MELHTVFDAGCGWGLLQPLFEASFMIVAASVLVYQPKIIKFKGNPNPKTVAYFGWVMISFMVLWASTEIYSTFHERKIISNARVDGNIGSVEGYVTEYTSTQSYGRDYEHFCIRTKCFSYADSVNDGGFHQTSFHGGPIRLGIYAKIEYIGSIITHLELSDDN